MVRLVLCEHSWRGRDGDVIAVVMERVLSVWAGQCDIMTSVYCYSIHGEYVIVSWLTGNIMRGGKVIEGTGQAMGEYYIGR